MDNFIPAFADELIKEAGVRENIIAAILSANMALALSNTKAALHKLQNIPIPSQPSSQRIFRHVIPQSIISRFNPRITEHSKIHGTGEGLDAGYPSLAKEAGIAASFEQLWKQADAVKNRITFDGMKLVLEYRAGDLRTGVDKDTGKKWERRMHAAYGYLPKTNRIDGEAIDIYLARRPMIDGQVFVVKQLTKDGKHDEDKVMLGFRTIGEAKAIYLRHVPEWCFGGINELSPKQFSQYLNVASRNIKEQK